MRMILALAAAPVFLLAAACGGSSATSASGPGAETPATQNTVDVAKENESESTGGSNKPEGKAVSASCRSIGQKMMDMRKAETEGVGSATSVRNVATALDKLAADLSQEKIAEADLKAAVDDLTAESKSFATQMKAAATTLDEIAKTSDAMRAWRDRVKVAGDNFDKACASGPKAECESLGAELERTPRVQDGDLVGWAKNLETFVAHLETLKPKDANVKSAFSGLTTALKGGAAPARKMVALSEDAKKLELAGDTFKKKVSRVAGLCGVSEDDLE